MKTLSCLRPDFPLLALRAAASASALLLVLISVTPVAWSAENLWSFDGPEGGVASVAASPTDPDFLLAASPSHVYRWDVSNSRWQRTAVVNSASAFVFSQSDVLTAFALGGSSYVIKTVDGGQTFSDSGDGLPAGQQAIDLALGSDGRLYVALSGDAVWVSDDGGDNWSAAGDSWPAGTGGVGFARPASIATATSDANRVYAALSGDTIIVSSDRGQTWATPTNVGLSVPLNFSAFVYVDPLDADHVIVGGLNPFESFDGGASWTGVPFNWVRGFASMPGSPATLYAAVSSPNGVYRSSNSGDDWVFESAIPGGSLNVAVSPDGSAMVGTADGIYRKPDSASAWTRAADGFVASNGNGLTQSPQSGRLYLDGNGVFSSADSAASWQSAGGGPEAAGGLPAGTVRTVAVSPEDDQVVYAALQSSSAIYRSLDGGQSWSVHGDLISAEASQIVVAPSDDSHLYAMTTDGRVWASVDAGLKWLPRDSAPAPMQTNVIAVHPQDADTVLAGQFFGGAFQSTDGGETWVSVAPDSSPNAGPIFTLFFSKANADIAYATQSSLGVFKVYRSVDRGLNWAPTMTNALWFDEHPVEAGVFIASGTGGSGVRRSVDGGLTWETIGETVALSLGSSQFSGTEGVYFDRLTSYQLYGFGFAQGAGRYTISRDLETTVASLDDTITLDELGDFAVRVFNASSGVSGRVDVTIPAPVNGRVVGAATANGICSLKDDGAECRINILDGFGNTFVFLDVEPLWFGPIEVTAFVSSVELESQPQDNTDTDRGLSVVSADIDGDGVTDVADNCLLAANNDQRDSNGDGFGNRCDADLNNDNVVNITDLGILRSVFFTADPDADFNGDGVVNVTDLGIMRAGFFAAPGPSGLVPPSGSR